MTITSTEQPFVIDTDKRYSVSYMPGSAFYVTGWDTTEVYEGDYLACEDEECDHALSEMCWVAGDTSIVASDNMVKAIMVGDDRVHIIDIDDLTEISDDDYCGGCGQIGCTHDGRDRG